MSTDPKSYSGIITRWKNFRTALATVEQTKRDWHECIKPILDFVEKASKVSGYPNVNGYQTQRFEGVELVAPAEGEDDFTVRVSTSTYCGEGHYEPDKREIVFPLRWTIPDYNWEPELRAEMARVQAAREARAAKEREDRESGREAEERATLERLKAKYESQEKP